MDMTFPAIEAWVDLEELRDEPVITHCDSSATEPEDAVVTTETSDETDHTNDAPTKAERERLLMEQTEAARVYLVEAAESTQLDELSESFARTTAAIIGLWQERARGRDPTSHIIDFDMDLKINLLMILAILPERYQGAIQIEDKSRSPGGDGNALSWLHEDTMILLIRLYQAQSYNRSFGQGLASMISSEIDSSWKDWYQMSYLEHQINQLDHNQLSEEEMKLYLYPPWTDQIVFFFNPTGIHWTLVEILIDKADECWTYTLYNSLSQGRRCVVWQACKAQLPLLEHLICRVSGFAEPEYRDFVVGLSPQQKNCYDCGPIAVFNGIGLLNGWVTMDSIDTEHLRLWYLAKILAELKRAQEADSIYPDLDRSQKFVDSETVFWESTVK